jgi:hypothetical protein
MKIEIRPCNSYVDLSIRSDIDSYARVMTNYKIVTGTLSTCSLGYTWES